MLNISQTAKGYYKMRPETAPKLSNGTSLNDFELTCNLDFKLAILFKFYNLKIVQDRATVIMGDQ